MIHQTKSSDHYLQTSDVTDREDSQSGEDMIRSPSSSSKSLRSPAMNGLQYLDRAPVAGPTEENSRGSALSPILPTARVQDYHATSIVANSAMYQPDY